MELDIAAQLRGYIVRRGFFRFRCAIDNRRAFLRRIEQAEFRCEFCVVVHNRRSCQTLSDCNDFALFLTFCQVMKINDFIGV